MFIEGSDVRAKRMARKAGSLIIFIVDASGSMALNRMNAAKGAAMSLLQEAYQSRDKICIIPFQVRLVFPPVADALALGTASTVVRITAVCLCISTSRLSKVLLASLLVL